MDRPRTNSSQDRADGGAGGRQTYMPIEVTRLLLYVRLLLRVPHNRPLMHLNLDIQSKRTNRRAAISANWARSDRDHID